MKEVFFAFVSVSCLICFVLAGATYIETGDGISLVWCGIAFVGALVSALLCRKEYNDSQRKGR